MQEPASSGSFLDTLLEPELASSISSHSPDPEQELEPASSPFCCCLGTPTKPARKGKNEVKLVDLFKKNRMKGWWPVYQGTEVTVSGGKEQ